MSQQQNTDPKTASEVYHILDRMRQYAIKVHGAISNEAGKDMDALLGAGSATVTTVQIENVIRAIETAMDNPKKALHAKNQQGIAAMKAKAGGRTNQVWDILQNANDNTPKP